MRALLLRSVRADIGGRFEPKKTETKVAVKRFGNVRETEHRDRVKTTESGRTTQFCNNISYQRDLLKNTISRRVY